MPDKRPLTPASEAMAKITAAHLVRCLAQSGFVVMRKPAAEAHSYSPGKDCAAE